MSTILFAYLGACFVCSAILIAVGRVWRKSKDRATKADEANLDAACEGAMIRELSDFTFARSGK